MLALCPTGLEPLIKSASSWAKNASFGLRSERVRMVVWAQVRAKRFAMASLEGRPSNQIRAMPCFLHMGMRSEESEGLFSQTSVAGADLIWPSVRSFACISAGRKLPSPEVSSIIASGDTNPIALDFRAHFRSFSPSCSW